MSEESVFASYNNQLLKDFNIFALNKSDILNNKLCSYINENISSYSSDISLSGTSVENVTEAAGNTVETPQTGDMTHIYWAGYLLVLSLMGIGFTILMAGKLKKEQ